MACGFAAAWWLACWLLCPCALFVDAKALPALKLLVGREDRVSASCVTATSTFILAPWLKVCANCAVCCCKLALALELGSAC